MSIITIHTNELPTNEGEAMRSKAANIAASTLLPAAGMAVNMAKAAGFAATTKVLKAMKLYSDETEFTNGNYRLSLGGLNEKSEFGKNIRNKVILKINANTSIEFLNIKIDVTQQNTIVKTALTGRVGTVKEYIKAEDHTVTMTGDLVSKMAFREAYPYDFLIMLLTVLKEKGRIAVVSKYLEAFGINNLVLESYQLNQSNNKYINTQHFNLKFVSDLEDDYFVIED